MLFLSRIFVKYFIIVAGTRFNLLMHAGGRKFESWQVYTAKLVPKFDKSFCRGCLTNTSAEHRLIVPKNVCSTERLTDTTADRLKGVLCTLDYYELVTMANLARFLS